MSNIPHPLTDSQLLDRAPSLFTQQAHHEASRKYHFIPTIDVVHQIRRHGWYPVVVQQSSVRQEDKEGYQRHLVRFRHFEDLIHPADNAIELLLFNSHDRSTAFSISAGIYRFVCANGLVVAKDVFDSYKIKHIGSRDSDVQTAIEEVAAVKPRLQKRIATFESIDLTRPEQRAFAKSSVSLRFEEHQKVDIDDLLATHRDEDENSDLYTTLNRIQENLIRGNIRGVNTLTGRRFISKPITSIDRDVDINQGLWSIAERIAGVKSPEPSQMALAA